MITAADVAEAMTGKPLIAEADSSWAEFLSMRAGMLQFMYRMMLFWAVAFCVVIWNLVRQLALGAPWWAGLGIGAFIGGLFAWWFLRLVILLRRILKAAAADADEEHRMKLARNEELRRKIAEEWVEVSSDEAKVIDELRQMAADTKEGE